MHMWEGGGGVGSSSRRGRQLWGGNKSSRRSWSLFLEKSVDVAGSRRGSVIRGGGGGSNHCLPPLSSLLLS